MEVNHILKLITDFLSEQNLHKTVACLIDEANMPHQQENYDKLVDSEDWPQLVKVCQRNAWRNSQALFTTLYQHIIDEMLAINELTLAKQIQAEKRDLVLSIEKR